MVYTICIGSNVNRKENLALARKRLSELFPNIRFSAEADTEPLFFRRQALFANQVARFTSDSDAGEVILHLKDIEREAGRTPEEKKQEIVRLDIDLLSCDSRVYKPEDLKRDYIIRGLKELNDGKSEATNAIETFLYNQCGNLSFKDMKFLGIIPARYASTRFPAKPLALLGGKTVIQRVYEQVAGVLDDAYVATDDERIEAAVKAFGGKVVMTSVHHKSGTDRCYEACTKVGEGFDVVVNIQGDEPFIQPSQLETVKACFDDPSTQIATLVKPFAADNGFEALENVNSPKVVLNKNMNALYFSRSIIPYQRNAEKREWLKNHTYYKHIGLYAYRVEVLKEITSLPQSSLELAESLEQLRWLENGYTIKAGITEVETIGIDTPQDLEHAERFLQARNAQ